MLPTTLTTKPHRPIRTLLSFVLLTFALSWGLWFALWKLFVAPPLALVTLGAWAPTIAALFITVRTEGWAGARALLGRVLRWRVAPGWYVAAALGPLGVALVTVLLASLLDAPLPSLVETAARFGLGAERAPLFFALLPVIFLVTFVSGGPLAEELGWRGFAQTRLQMWLRPTTAGLVVGAVWALWHLPLFMIAPAATAGLPLVAYLPLVTALGGVFGWFYARTGESVLLTMMLHAGVNLVLGALGLLGTSPQLGVFALLLWGLVGLGVWLEFRCGPKSGVFGRT